MLNSVKRFFQKDKNLIDKENILTKASRLLHFKKDITQNETIDFLKECIKNSPNKKFKDNLSFLDSKNILSYISSNQNAITGTFKYFMLYSIL